MSFTQAQHRWESSWENGPADDPLDLYYEELAEMSLEELEAEVRHLKHFDEDIRPGMQEPMLAAAKEELRVRESETDDD